MIDYFDDEQVVLEDPMIVEIQNLDLSMIKLKLRDSEEGPGWSAVQSEEVEEEYRRFLALKRLYPDLEIVPNKMVDTFWHYHILDTASYARDCDTVFGYFLHHFPYFGMRGEEDYRNLCDAFEETKRLYALHFGSDYQASFSRCRTECKPVKCK